MKVRRTNNNTLDRIAHPYDGKNNASPLAQQHQQLPEDRIFSSADRNDSSSSLNSNCSDESRASATMSSLLENKTASWSSPQQQQQSANRTHRRSQTTFLGYSES
mmetsp:Transcript_27519/g.40658  ORF Transcript_27519/g.40658 Transcript_27519/m.40658 type:complete len:105 (+) Transcript_27519:159-473(+)|eukprot:CAMPEP_0194212236 /NCGR_PEP_ID=MMETSP0156-20130528/11940_1 /TAXON_ID=33649 /ORGANISM="Thalassionema nitzschioides, Strain L26-B" /LENGTH=104 /DNA_ID=CAMNT_0038940011 /DNA_START=68 /DNA_END=382 /DNA_ORIENTATION=+